MQILLIWKEAMAAKLLTINAQFSTLSIVTCISIRVAIFLIGYVLSALRTAFGPQTY